MAIYHIDIKAHSRSLNVHAIALSSYRSGEKLLCDADGKIRNCRRGTKSAVAFTALLNNRDLSRERLWNKAEAMERRKDAVVAREIELGLPCELSLQEHKELSLTMGQKIAERYNCAVDLAVHAPDLEGDTRNWHVHLLFTSRSWADKDEKRRTFSSKKYRDLNKANAKEEVLFWRELWEGMVNEAYEKQGLEERVSSQSCEVQGKLKKYEHFDFKKYQLLRRSGELDDAKKASRLGLEIERDELEIEDLMEIKADLLREREKVLNNKLKKEMNYVGLGEKNGQSGTGESDHTETELRHTKSIKETGAGTGSVENSQRSTRTIFTNGGDNDQGFRGVEASAGSRGNEQAIGLGGKAWKGIKQTTKRLWEFIFKGEVYKKLLLCKEKEDLKKANEMLAEENVEGNLKSGLIDFTGIWKTKTQEFIESLDLREYKADEIRANLNFFREHIGDEHKIEQYEKIRLELREKIFKRKDFSLEYSLLKLFDLEAIEQQRKPKKKPTWKDKWSAREVSQIEAEIRRIERDFRNEHFQFKRAEIKSDLKTVVIAREVTRNLFGSIKSTRNVIIDFNKHYAHKNLEKGASQSSIEEVKQLSNGDGFIDLDNNIRYLQKDYKAKSGWKVYELEIDSAQSLEEVLKRECQSFEIDPFLIKQLNETKQKHQGVIDRWIEDIKANGLYSWRPKKSISLNLGQDINRGRGFKI
ncbi:MAG: MobA/MobL family protein [Lentisphaeraceae bacterium]|nr:MobA/MobL family protein [Lentisphaeraceae bacterium]